MEKWLSAVEVSECMEKINNCDKLFQIYCLSSFVNNAIYSEDFIPEESWEKNVVLSSSGINLKNKMHDSGISFPAHIEHFTMFRLFYHRELLIDFEASNFDELLEVVKKYHKENIAKWPYVFGNLLYNKFNDKIQTNQTSELDFQTVKTLLDGTPQGVFQVGTLLSGPLGFLESRETRLLLPTLNLLLWHCSDPGCRAKHAATLRPFNSDIKKAKSTMIRFIGDELGPPSEWKKPLLLFSRKDKFPSGRPYYDLPSIIGECIFEKERELLLLRGLQSRHNNTLMTAIKTTKNIDGNPATIIDMLSPEEQHQLLMLIPDTDLVIFIDELICKEIIKIPPDELRRAKNTFRIFSKDMSSEISSIGIRQSGLPAVVYMANTIWQAYEELEITDDLSWLLRDYPGTSIKHSIVSFIRSKENTTSIKELMLSSRSITSKICEKIIFNIIEMESEESICKRALWKFGFASPRFEEENLIFRKRVSEFKDLILNTPEKNSESERATIRSSGVNLFVSLESFLENLICYNTWLMGSDHFLCSNFYYNRKKASMLIYEILGEKITSGHETFTWSHEGNNTLGCLIAYIQFFRLWINDRLDAEKIHLQRNEKDFPHYAENTFVIFPYKHTQLWADVDRDILINYIDLINTICAQLSKADLLSVRNGIDHKRDEGLFPALDKMLACTTRLEQALDLADNNRLIPKLFWKDRSEIKKGEHACHYFTDYRGKQVTIWTPTFVSGSPKILFGTPYLIAPFDFLNQPNSILVFGVTTTSPFQKYWEGYPRRRPIPPGSNSNSDNEADKTTEPNEFQGQRT